MQAGELPLPPEANADAKARELLRVWAAHNKQHVTLATNLWNDPAAWGIVLVDLAKHISIAYQQSAGLDPASVLARIKQGFDAEWATATDQPTGELL